MALKVVVADETYILRIEYAMNLSICKETQCVVRATKFDRTELGAGMLMDEVGLAVKPGAAWDMATAKATLAGALVALRDLHAAGYCHVSARLDNLLDCGGRIKWCDVQRAMEHKGDASLMYRDVRKPFPPPVGCADSDSALKITTLAGSSLCPSAWRSGANPERRSTPTLPRSLWSAWARWSDPLSE